MKESLWDIFNNKSENEINNNILKYIESIKKKKITYKYKCNFGFLSNHYILTTYEFSEIPFIITGKKSLSPIENIIEKSFIQFRKINSTDNFIMKKTKIRAKNEIKMNKSIINMLSIQEIILKSLYFFKEDNRRINLFKKYNDSKNEGKVLSKKLTKKLLFNTNSSKILLKTINKKNSMNSIDSRASRKMIKRSSTLIKEFNNNLKKQSSKNYNEVNINRYSLLHHKQFFSKRKPEDRFKRREGIILNEKDIIIQDNQDIDSIYLELIKYIFEGKNKLFIDFYKKHKVIDIDQELFDGNTLLILSAKDGNLTITKFLCEEGCEVNIQNHRGNTALHYAIGKQFYGVADILTRHGAREDIRNFNGLTPWECVDHNIDE